MKRSILKLKKFRYYIITISTLRGFLLFSVLIMLFSYAGLHIDLTDALISVMLLTAFSAGGILSGYTYGRNKRRNGIKGGLICGAVMFLISAIFGIIYSGGIPSIKFVKYLIILCTSGVVGGVYGVNTRIKHPPV